MMRKVALLVALLSLSLHALPATADVKPTPAPTSTLSPMAQYQMDFELFKIEMREYQEARALREQELRVILIEFNKALRRASEDARIAGKSAGSKATLASARAAAATARDEAVALLGPEPIAPTPPMKPMKGTKASKETQKPRKKN
jgi:hypothetical protein